MISTLLSLAERKRHLAAYPHVTHLPTSKKPCEGYSWTHHRNCKRHGTWKLKALRTRSKWGERARSGVYCYVHVSREIFSHNIERDRFMRWYETYEADDERQN